MNQNEQGMVYAFRLSGSRMRQSAVQLRRQGQTLDALALVRRAAEQEDTPSAWQTLAAELRRSGNWEVAAQLLARVLSREPHQPGAWADMAQCMRALGQNDLAVDCAYHQLQEDPWAQESDAARNILAALDVARDDKEPRRTQRMIHRGLSAWQSGNRERGEKNIRRALRIAADKPRLLVTTAMLCMLELDFDGALHYLPRALKHDPEDPRTLTALSTLYQQQGKRRLARGLLQKAGKYAESVLAEDGFLTAAWAQDAWPEMQEYLAVRMKQHPHRIPLMSAKATMAAELAQQEAACQLWKDVLAINPDDRNAATKISWLQNAPEHFFGAPGMLPRSERQRQLTELRMAAESLPMADMLRPGSRELRLLDWMIASSDVQERQYAQALLESSDALEIVPYLKELLCRPFLRYDVRQWALVRLAEMGHQEEMLILAGDHYTLVACQKVGTGERPSAWRKFLPELLKETRRCGQSSDVAQAAAAVWKHMTDEERAHAAGAGCQMWCKAMEIYFLCTQGEDASALHTMQETPQSVRRIRRILRRIHRYMT